MAAYPTPEVACQALGLPGFYRSYQRGLPKQELSILLRPSFHTKLAILFSELDAQTSVQVVCSPKLSDEAKLGAGTLAKLEVSFRTALAERDSLGIVLDGMRVDACWRTYDKRLILEGANPVSGTALAGFVASIITIAFDATNSDTCRGYLGDAGRYVGLTLKPQ